MTAKELTEFLSHWQVPGLDPKPGEVRAMAEANTLAVLHAAEHPMTEDEIEYVGKTVMEILVRQTTMRLVLEGRVTVYRDRPGGTLLIKAVTT